MQARQLCGEGDSTLVRYADFFDVFHVAGDLVVYQVACNEPGASHIGISAFCQ